MGDGRTLGSFFGAKWMCRPTGRRRTQPDERPCARTDGRHLVLVGRRTRDSCLARITGAGGVGAAMPGISWRTPVERASVPSPVRQSAFSRLPPTPVRCGRGGGGFSLGERLTLVAFGAPAGPGDPMFGLDPLAVSALTVVVVDVAVPGTVLGSGRVKRIDLHDAPLSRWSCPLARTVKL